MSVLLTLLFFANALFYDGEIVKAQIANSPPLELEVVKKQESIVRGLSNRDEIGHDGMLFVYDIADRHAFWMKDMRFNLDMIWLHDGIVVDLVHDAQAPICSDSYLPLYTPRGPANMVLEIESGKAKAWNIKQGSRLTLVD